MLYFYAVGLSEIKTVVPMQDNPSYASGEEDITLDPNPCYSAMQTVSVHEPINDKGKGWYTVICIGIYELVVFVMQTLLNMVGQP